MAFFLLSFVFVLRGGMRDTMLVTLAVGRIQYGGGGDSNIVKLLASTSLSVFFVIIIIIKCLEYFKSCIFSEY